MAPKKKAPRLKKASPDALAEVAAEAEPPALKVERRGDGVVVVVVESAAKKIEQMAALDVARLGGLNLEPGERGLGLGSELTRPQHGNATLEELSKMRQEKFLTDLELGCKTKSFDVHKLVISSVSRYFREILAKDPDVKRLELPSLSPLGLANVITFAYLGRVHMSLYTIGCTASAAAALRIPQLLEMCGDFLLAELNAHTCVYVWNIAAAYGLLPVCHAARRFVLDNFARFADTPLFTQLTAEQMCAFLADDSLGLPSELDAFQLATKWLDSEPSRQAHAAALLSHVRLESIPPGELVSRVQTVPRMMRDPQCHRLLVDAMNYHLLPHRQNALQSGRTRVRGSRLALIAVGGRPSLTERALSREVLWREPREGGAAWRHLSQLPAKSFNQCVAVMDGFLYVAGGEDQNDARNQAKHAVATLRRYDPRFHTWLHLANMRQRRTHFSLAASGGRLFATGGRNAEGLLATAESYLPSANAWQMRAPMEVPRCCHSSATLPSGDILVTGGYVNCAYSRSVACYGVEGDAWTEKPAMETPRGWHCSAALGGKVYVVGGSRLGPGGERVDVLAVEVFSPEGEGEGEGAWSRVAPLPLGVSTAGLSPLGPDELWLLGGWNEAEKRYEAAVQTYDPATDSWARAEDLPEPTVGVSCCALALPPRHPPRRQQHRNTPARDEAGKNRGRESSPPPESVTA
ncbi:kelch-like protein 31 isoform X1 [Phyllopteryx taeniolatus]|uniref:kelch-like protein 31 isoform X1 n=1 Tax=Phyllopteryx taeniolatus TaxID=161469 RepID=UPI002AD3EE48|nr:kelch-like protein 31 isoform X1 [Phyllopteryx taeniolatus]